MSCLEFSFPLDDELVVELYFSALLVPIDDLLACFFGASVVPEAHRRNRENVFFEDANVGKACYIQCQTRHQRPFKTREIKQGTEDDFLSLICVPLAVGVGFQS